MDFRRSRIVCISDRHRIEASVALPSEGHHSRLSDYLNQRDRDFIPLEDAEVRPLDDPDRVERHPFLLVSRAHLRIITPGDGEPPEQDG